MHPQVPPSTSTAPRRSTATRTVAITAALVMSLTLSACGSASSAPPPAEVEIDAVTLDTGTLDTGTLEEVSGGTAANLRAGLAGVDVFTAPAPDAEVVVTLGATTDFGSPTTLGVVATQPGWVQVQVAARPNGTTGWVPASALEVVAVPLVVEVDRAARTLVVTDGGTEILRSEVAVGSSEAPTPSGRFFVTDLLATGSTAGPYGPYAFGLSAFSEVLSEFAGGSGQVGIHGTDDPASIGQAVSHGCVRVPNETIEALAGLLPLGTPVVIT